MNRANEIDIVDFKYGKGVAVSAIENYQMILYAIGFVYLVMEKYKNIKIEKITMHIFQPRKDIISTSSITLDKLRDYARIIKKTMREIEQGIFTYTAGKKQCTFCNHKPNCEAYKEWQDKEVLQML